LELLVFSANASPVGRMRQFVMSTIAEIEAVIERLPTPAVEELARWLDALRARRAAPTTVDSWLERATGAAVAGTITAGVMAATRGEE
jgi:hypothetical protein